MTLTKALLNTIRDLRLKATRRETGWILAEGPHPVIAAFKAGLVPVVLLHQPGWDTDAVNLTEGRYPVSEETIRKVCTTDSPPPVLAVFESPKVSAPPKEADGTWLGLVGLQDPGNVGTLLRCAKAFGLNGIFATVDTVDLWSPKVIRASAGVVFDFPMWSDCFDIAAMQAMLPLETPLYATTSHELASQSLQAYHHVTWSDGGLLLLGNEGSGLQLPTDGASSGIRLVTIPQEPSVESLNVAVSGAVIMAEMYRQASLKKTSLPV